MANTAEFHVGQPLPLSMALQGWGQGAQPLPHSMALQGRGQGAPPLPHSMEQVLGLGKDQNHLHSIWQEVSTYDYYTILNTIITKISF